MRNIVDLDRFMHKTTNDRVKSRLEIVDMDRWNSRHWAIPFFAEQ